jgi:hypothetical protein
MPLQPKRSVEGSASLILLGCVAVGIALLFIEQAMKPAPVVPPMYKTGECGKNSRNPDSDGEQDDGTVFKIMSVGKKNYEILKGNVQKKTMYVGLHKQSIETLDPGTEKVECPKELNDPKTLEKARNG